jgi:hypothetical protein
MIAFFGGCSLVFLVYLCVTSHFMKNYLNYRIWSCCRHPTWDWVEIPVTPMSACFFRQCPDCGALEYQQWRYLLLSPHED